MKKRCSKCKAVKPISAFGKNKNCADGLQSECKHCGWLYRSTRRAAINQRNREYRRQNPDKQKAYWAKRYAENLDHERSRSKKYRESNPEKVKEIARRHYAEHPERRREAREKHMSKPGARDRMREMVRKCRKAKPEQYLSYTHTRRARIKGNGGSYTAEEWKALCKLYRNACLCCGRTGALVVDHVIPITKGGTSNIDNLQPLCKSCNSRKHNKTIDYRRPRVEIEITEIGVVQELFTEETEHFMY